jgi:hypothetical protein
MTASASLLQTAVPRANHLLRMLPPSLSQEYAAGHDDSVRECLSKLLQQPRSLSRQSAAWQCATLPLRLGGVGLRSAARTAPAACWGAWADALDMLRARCRNWAETFCEVLQDPEGQGGSCLQEAAAAGRLLDDEGWEERPSWPNLLTGARPQQPRSVQTTQDNEVDLVEPGEWRHGWQHCACSIRESRFREHELLPRLSRDRRALLRSGSGAGAGSWLKALPTSPATTLRPELLQVAQRRRLRLPLLLGARRCSGHSCRASLGRLGDHLASCSLTGLVQRRAKPVERAWAQVLREAGARVMPQQLLKDMDLAINSAEDGRRVDVVAYGLSAFGGLPLCGDATLVSPSHRDGEPWRGADATDGVRLRAARGRKEIVYPELAGGVMAKLAVLGHEVGGRWAPEALRLLQNLARDRCSQVPKLLQRSAKLAWHRRWLCSASRPRSIFSRASCLVGPMSTRPGNKEVRGVGRVPCTARL